MIPSLKIYPYFEETFIYVFNIRYKFLCPSMYWEVFNSMFILVAFNFGGNKNGLCVCERFNSFYIFASWKVSGDNFKIVQE